jgi:Family of unknown function (DUF5681)
MTKKPKESGYSTDPSHPLYDPTMDPNHPSYDQDKADSEAKSASSDGDTYKVGPGFPPNEYKWKKGCPSPYPKGRPRKAPSMKPDLKKALESALDEKVVITKDKKEIVLTKAALGIQQLVNQFAKGDRYARRDLFQYASLLGVELHAKDIIEEALGVDDQAIVDAAFRRIAQQAAPEASADDHVKAPPDLLDDDLTPSDSTERPDSPPQPEAKRPPEPALNKKSRPMSEAESKYADERHSHFLAEQKKRQGGS